MKRLITRITQQIVPTCIVFVCTVSTELAAAPPPDLPGDEISEEYFEFLLPQDSIEKEAPPAIKQTRNWLDKAMNTWLAPSLTSQLSADKSFIPMGKGAVFIPRMSDASLEPEIEILDSVGTVVLRDKPGQKFNLLPGRYFALIGSGSHEQRIVRQFIIEESKVVPLIPNWGALSITTVDSSNVPFRGEYELARIDVFEPLGRGFGPDPNLGEESPKTWILKPGLYKIFAVGEGYNTLSNFITVRIIGGEMTEILLVQDSPESMNIISGGAVNLAVKKTIFPNWRYGLDVGGSFDFNSDTDHEADSNATDVSFKFSLLLNLNVNYEKDAIDWDSRVRIDEGINLEYEDRDIAALESSTDKFRLSSIFTWRFFERFGPYARLGSTFELIPAYSRSGSASQHYFLVCDEDYGLSNIDTSDSYQLQPVISPFTFEAGIGANVDVFSTRYIESRLLGGFGFKRESAWGTAEEIGLGDVITEDTTSQLYQEYNEIVSEEKSATAVRKFDNIVTSPEYGPEASFNLLARLGKLAIVETDYKIFIPVERMGKEDFRPDMEWMASLRWRLVKSVTLDYRYEYTLRWPEEITSRVNDSKHRVLIRFSFTNR